MNDFNKSRDEINNYFFSIVEQIIIKKYYLVFLLLFGFIISFIYNNYNETITYKSDYIIKRNGNIDTELGLNFNQLIDTNNQLDILNKIVSTERLEETLKDDNTLSLSAQQLENKENRELKDLLMLGSLLDLDLASGATKEFLELEGGVLVKKYLEKNFFNLENQFLLSDEEENIKIGFVSIVNKNNLTNIDLEIQDKKIFRNLLEQFNTSIEIHNLTDSNYNYEFTVKRLDGQGQKINKHSFAIVNIRSNQLLDHTSIIKKELENINRAILLDIKSTINAQSVDRVKDFNNVINQAKNFMIFYKQKYQNNENVEVNLSTQEYYVNQIVTLAEIEIENIRKFNEFLNDILIYELVVTSDNQTISDKRILRILIFPILLLLMFVSFIVLSNILKLYFIFVNKNK